MKFENIICICLISDTKDTFSSLPNTTTLINLEATDSDDTTLTYEITQCGSSNLNYCPVWMLNDQGRILCYIYIQRHLTDLSYPEILRMNIGFILHNLRRMIFIFTIEKTTTFEVQYSFIIISIVASMFL